MVLVANDCARRTATVGKRTLHNQRRLDAQRKLVAALSDVLEAGLIHNRRTDDLSIADLHRLFRAMRVVSHRRKRKLSDTAVVLGAVHVLIADRQGVAERELEVEARTD